MPSSVGPSSAVNVVAGPPDLIRLFSESMNDHRFNMMLIAINIFNVINAAPNTPSIEPKLTALTILLSMRDASPTHNQTTTNSTMCPNSTALQYCSCDMELDALNPIQLAANSVATSPKR